MHAGNRFRRLFRAGEGGERISVRPQPVSAKRDGARNGQGLRCSRLWKSSDLSGSSVGALGDPIAPGDQSAQHGRGGRFRRSSGGRVLLRRSVLFPHGTKLGEPRLFPEGRPQHWSGGSARRISRAILRRQAAAAPHSRFARFWRASTACRSADGQIRAQSRGERAAARRTQGTGAARLGQCARSTRAQACGHIVATKVAGRLEGNVLAAAPPGPDWNLRQQPHRRDQRSGGHGRRRTRRLSQKPVSQVQYSIIRSYARGRLRDDARSSWAAIQTAAWREPSHCGEQRAWSHHRRSWRPALARFVAHWRRAGATQCRAGNIDRAGHHRRSRRGDCKRPWSRCGSRDLLHCRSRALQAAPARPFALFHRAVARRGPSVCRGVAPHASQERHSRSRIAGNSGDRSHPQAGFTSTFWHGESDRAGKSARSGPGARN